ncbi:MAG: hypothetical protein V2J55_10470 [Candidatus Competibacteraceae bacterium]|jgi:hypothetical protein|nr:hypothetical protein [Candidatus Competibacteraceae bacterium]
MNNKQLTALLWWIHNRGKEWAPLMDRRAQGYNPTREEIESTGKIVAAAVGRCEYLLRAMHRIRTMAGIRNHVLRYSLWTINFSMLRAIAILSYTKAMKYESKAFEVEGKELLKKLRQLGITDKKFLANLRPKPQSPIIQ